VAALREQLEVAKSLGLVEVRPRTGIRRLPYRFFPAISHSLSYAMQLAPTHFRAFADLRQHLEICYWHEAVRLLTAEDHAELKALVAKAWEKLHGNPVHIPHAEHRRLHMALYQRLDNLFVTDLMEAYWDAYEAVGLNVYTDYEYLRQVWTYHQDMVDAIYVGEFERGYQAMVAHTELLDQLPVPG
jgi:DNA-binding FadR family transcriptional regulator